MWFKDQIKKAEENFKTQYKLRKKYIESLERYILGVQHDFLDPSGKIWIQFETLWFDEVQGRMEAQLLHDGESYTVNVEDYVSLMVEGRLGYTELCNLIHSDKPSSKEENISTIPSKIKTRNLLQENLIQEIKEMGKAEETPLSDFFKKTEDSKFPTLGGFLGGGSPTLDNPSTNNGKPLPSAFDIAGNPLYKGDEVYYSRKCSYSASGELLLLTITGFTKDGCVKMGRYTSKSPTTQLIKKV